MKRVEYLHKILLLTETGNDYIDYTGCPPCADLTTAALVGEPEEVIENDGCLGFLCYGGGMMLQVLLLSQGLLGW